MRKLHRYQATRLQKQLETSDKVVQVWHMCQHIVPDNEIRRPAIFNEVARSFFAEKEHFRLYAFSFGYLCHICRRLHTEDGNSSCYKILQEVPVVTGNLNNLGVLAKTEPRSDHIDIRLGMSKP